MKKTLILLLFSIGTFQLAAQRIEKAPKSKTYYQQKSEKQKTAGWVFLVGGSLLTVAGISTATSEPKNVIEIFSPIYGTLIASAGAGFAIGGITLLSSSRKNARKAAQISFSSQTYRLPAGNLVSVKMQPTVSLRIPFGNN